MASPDRVLRQRDLHAMVALDTIDMIAERVTNLLSHGRRMTTVRRCTYVGSPPTVTAGLTLDGEPKTWKGTGGVGFGVQLKPGIMSGFGFSCYGSDGNATEKEAWARFHAAESISDDPFKRRRDMTEVQINGGLPGDGPARDDQLVIRHWDGDGVCEEVVVAFDYDTRSGRESAEVDAKLAELAHTHRRHDINGQSYCADHDGHNRWTPYPCATRLTVDRAGTWS